MSLQSYEFKKKFPRVTESMVHGVHAMLLEDNARRLKRNRIYCEYLDARGAPETEFVEIPRPAWAERLPDDLGNSLES